MPSASRPQGVEHAIQLRGAGNRPETRDERYRDIGHPAGHRGKRHQAGRVRPLQVIGADHDRAGQSQVLHQITEGVDDPVLQPWIACDRDRSLSGVAARSRQQSRDRGSPRIATALVAAEGACHQAERTCLFQLIRASRDDPYATGGRVGQRLFE